MMFRIGIQVGFPYSLNSDMLAYHLLETCNPSLAWWPEVLDRGVNNFFSPGNLCEGVGMFELQCSSWIGHIGTTREFNLNSYTQILRVSPGWNAPAREIWTRTETSGVTIAGQHAVLLVYKHICTPPTPSLTSSPHPHQTMANAHICTN